MEDNPKIITGSAYFFSSMPGFSPKDKDYVSYQEHPVKFKLLGCLFFLIYFAIISR